MVNPNPATPAADAAATPGSGEHGSNPPSVTPAAPATPAPGNNNEGTVTIPVKEYRDLQRNDARARSFGKRIYQKSTQPATNADPNDPAAVERARADAAERKALQLEVKGKVQDLLADDRFKNIPQSTKKLILDAPHMLSEAETLDDAMYDIEDRLIEIAAVDSNIPVTIKTNDTPAANNQPANRETPPIVTPGTPAPVDTATMEDTSQLRGSARSQAALRNAFKKGGVAGMRPAQQ